MKVRIMKPWFAELITPTIGITLPWGVYIKEGEDDVFTVNHELIHWQQVKETLFIFFYIWYGLEWFIKWITPPVGAYFDLGFEREAYRNEFNLNYLTTRKHFAWFKYIFS